MNLICSNFIRHRKIEFGFCLLIKIWSVDQPISIRNRNLALLRELRGEPNSNEPGSRPLRDDANAFICCGRAAQTRILHDGCVEPPCTPHEVRTNFCCLLNEWKARDGRMLFTNGQNKFKVLETCLPTHFSHFTAHLLMSAFDLCGPSFFIRQSVFVSNNRTNKRADERNGTTVTTSTVVGPSRRQSKK